MTPINLQAYIVIYIGHTLHGATKKHIIRFYHFIYVKMRISLNAYIVSFLSGIEVLRHSARDNKLYITYIQTANVTSIFLYKAGSRPFNPV